MSKTILVVEDEALIAFDIQFQLEKFGHRVVVASDVLEAMALLDREGVDVAIVDWHLRAELSARLIDVLKQRHIPFVVCTGSVFEELAGLFPTSSILTKPFGTVELLAALNRVVNGWTVQ